MKNLRTISLATLGFLAVMCTPAKADTTLNYNQPTTGVISPAGGSVYYSLAVNAKDVLNFNIVATLSTSGTFGPCIALYDPSGNEVDSAGGNYNQAFPMDNYLATVAGGYTVVISDCANQATGDFTLFVQKSNNPISVPLNYAAPKTGTITSAAQENAYTFTANANDILDLNVVATSSKSGTLGPCVFLYNSTGTPVLDADGGNYSQAFFMNPYKVPAAGTFNLLIEDCALTATGNYTLFLQKSNAPVDAIPIVYGETQAATVTSAAQSNAYTLFGTEGDVLNFTIATTASTSGTLGPCIALFNTTNPQPLEAAGGNYNQNYTMNNYKVPATGTYTVIMSDCALTATGSYNLTSDCIGTCDLPIPTISTISPASAAEGSPGFALTVYGSGFAKTDAKSVVEWEGPGKTTFTSLATTWISTGQLTAVVPATDLTTLGTAKVQVFTPSPGGGTSNTVPFTINGPTATPTCSPLPGTYPPPLSVTLADATPGAAIYYTTNGASPTTSSTKYTGPIAVATSETIKAIADASGFPDSGVASCAYIVEPVTTAPIFSPAASTYTNEIAVTLNDATAGATIYYTTNPTAPLSAFTKYTGPIPVRTSESIRAFATAPGYADSIVSSAAYVIIGSPSALSAEATAIATPDATLNAVVNTNGLAGSYHFLYATSSGALTNCTATSTAATALPASPDLVNVSANLATLKTKTTYYYQVVVTTNGGTATGSVLSFTTN